jgi:hypothetical protein
MYDEDFEGPTIAFCDNEVVCKSTMKTEAVLIKKHHSMAYHPDRKTEATDYTCVQVRDSNDSAGPINKDKDSNEERKLVGQVYLVNEFFFSWRCGFSTPRGRFPTSS